MCVCVGKGEGGGVRVFTPISLHDDIPISLATIHHASFEVVHMHAILLHNCIQVLPKQVTTKLLFERLQSTFAFWKL